MSMTKNELDTGAISILEALCMGIQHAAFNASMLEITALSFPNNAIRFFAEIEHVREVREIVDPVLRSRIEWVPIEIPQKGASFIQRAMGELRLLRRISRYGSAIHHLLILAAVESTIAAVKLMHATNAVSMPVQAILHGYLNDIVGWRSRNPLRRSTDLRSILTHWNDGRLQYIVLEEAIARQLGLLLPKLKGQLDWISCPIPTTKSPDPVPSIRRPIRIGFLGLATRQKGFEVFLSLAEAFRQAGDSRVEFHAFGRIPGSDQTMRSYPMLHTPPAVVGLPTKDYVQSVASLHYVCLPYQGSHYELSASGVLLDAIAFLKPVIALPSPVLRDLFARKPDIGFLCDGPLHLTETVQKILGTMDERRYEAQVGALRELRDERCAYRLTERYREITLGWHEQFRRQPSS